MLTFLRLLLCPICLAYKCEWHIRLSNFTNRDQFAATILQQIPSANLDLVFQNLSDQGIDLFNRLDHYFAFPYFLKIDLACGNKEENRIAALSAYFQGMQPIVNIRFQQPVHSVYIMPEILEIAVSGAPIADSVSECSAEICGVGWYVPLPFKNGSVVSEALITSNKIGQIIPDKNILLNIDGYLNLKLDLEVGVDPNIRQFDIGHEVVEIGNLIPIPNPSSPLWYLTENSPVLILGGITDRKVVILSTNEFDDFTILEVNIDSCWIGSLSCPQGVYSATVHDTIATESMLFIRQNQLMYYFKGNFTLLRHTDQGSDRWTRVLYAVCVERLIPVYLTMDNEEKLFVIGGGKHKAMAFIGTIKDGIVTFDSLLDTKGNTVCFILQRNCLVLWAALDRFQNATLLLVEGLLTEYEATSYYLVYYYFANSSFELHYKLPVNIPKEKQGFVLLLGTETYTNIPMIPMGITLSHMNSMAYIWGNFLFTSYNLGSTWLAVPGVPSYSLIRYFIPSWKGDFAFMTDIEELWYGKDGFPRLTRLRPSKGWTTFLEVEHIKENNFYHESETTLTVFFDRQKQLQEVVYAALPNGTTKIFKRAIPVEELLSYQEFFSLRYMTINSVYNDITFLENCPFGIMRIKILAPPLFYNRIQQYIAKPPWIFSNIGIYNNLSLIVYQGLVHGLLWLHSTYYRPYADPVHDPTWRWWKDSRTAQHYYFYLASNKLSKGGFYVEAYDYRKHYAASLYDKLPPVIYLDKSSSYKFIVYLNMIYGKRDTKYEINQVWMSAHVSSPEYVLVNLERQEILNRRSLIYKVTVKDREYYVGQSLSGENLVVLSVTIKVVNSDLVCFREYNHKIEMQGDARLKVYVGCPPGNRLAFDISYTLQYSTKKNNIYFDCIETNLEIPCFYYEIPFYPFFLIQDMVTGKSDRFWGRYTFKVIGGGPYSESNIRMFSEEEILMYNSMNMSDKYAAIWDIVDASPKDVISTEDGYRIFSGDSFGIQWICQKNSPCSDIPADGLKGPEYFLVIEVSNRGIGRRTYCNYRLEFLIHLHGLPLNPYRALIFMLTTLSILWFILFSYIILRCYQNWFDKRLKMLSSVEPMVLPARSGESDALYVHTANDLQPTSSSSNNSIHSASALFASSYNIQRHSTLRHPNVILKSHY
ncbi:cation channel sperm-associated protein subunit gamma-like isoform X1 [Scyliorhinus canicula]|uniref:cation channel sperm-associated protein subunit gamma-like isoform X1 n=1 Tax=Scyliorhinus canicula TaxID=7830 RepID=UPI0018F69E9B|nr:cation channel sperm-associated protein subunit gamma-like isoform X1 [Scyliorhinus canicula]